MRTRTPSPPAPPLRDSPFCSPLSLPAGHTLAPVAARHVFRFSPPPRGNVPKGCVRIASSSPRPSDDGRMWVGPRPAGGRRAGPAPASSGARAPNSAPSGSGGHVGLASVPARPEARPPQPRSGRSPASGAPRTRPPRVRWGSPASAEEDPACPTPPQPSPSPAGRRGAGSA
uniref:Basic proline-rich protein-like isoform X2 n=1 Tax=Phascolarctos cinereus TaxID=38626 RepID=A0A6P5KH86_PHACI|nr:basic proline-rich protein-like isoform X2 [Phascolarctos cinereus]